MNTRISHITLAVALTLAFALAGCIDESSNPVVFDQLLESATFENLLVARVVIFRDGIPIDTLDARTTGTYPINRKGAITHAWKLIAPIDNTGDRAGVEPSQNLGVQYKVRATYTIDSDALDNKTLFTPRISNLTPYSLRITANYGTTDQFPTNYTIAANGNSSIVNAPYFYWHASSNIRLTDVFGRSYQIDRDDSTTLGTLRLETDSYYRGAGLTEPITVY